MTKKIPEVRLVHSQNETIFNGLIGVVSLALMYYATHPTEWERHSDLMKQRWNAFTHRASVWQAIHAIRTLPETDDHQ